MYACMYVCILLGKSEAGAHIQTHAYIPTGKITTINMLVLYPYTHTHTYIPQEKPPQSTCWSDSHNHRTAQQQ